MFPPVYETLRASADVVQIVGQRIARHGEISQKETRPYVVWQVVGNDPHVQLSGRPCSDFTTIQIDCYHLGDRDVEVLARAVRDALDAARVVNRIFIDIRDPETKLYRVGLEADFITQR